MRKRSNLIYLQLIFLLAVMFLTIYSTYSIVSAKAQPEINTVQEEVVTEKPDKPDKPNKPAKFDISENMKLSAEINEYVKTIKNVSDSICFVMFDQCYVAFKCEDLVNKESIDIVEKEIEAGVSKKFSKIKKVFAKNDMNAFVKMESVVKRINAGEKITDLKKDIIELKKIFHGNRHHGHPKKRRM